jgi:cytochrome c oxidase assembly protein subunit 15
VARLTSFQRLALSTTAITYFLILVGGLVRASGAGLGCPDWPRCFGSWVPPLSVADLPARFDPAQFNPTLMWTEYLNRLLGVTVGLMILVTTISAWRHHRREPRILWSVVAALLLTGFQGWLGGQVVAHELAPWLVTVHLIVALVIVSLLLYATVYAFFVDRGVRAPGGARRHLAWAGLALILVTLTQVGFGAHVRGAVDDALQAGVPRATALQWGGWIDLLHREISLGVLAASLFLLWYVWRRHPGERPIALAAQVAAALAVLQIALGIVLAYAGLPPPAQVGHLVVASLMLGAQTVVVLLAWWLPVLD